MDAFNDLFYLGHDENLWMNGLGSLCSAFGVIVFNIFKVNVFSNFVGVARLLVLILPDVHTLFLPALFCFCRRRIVTVELIPVTVQIPLTDLRKDIKDQYSEYKINKNECGDDPKHDGVLNNDNQQRYKTIFK